MLDEASLGWWNAWRTGLLGHGTSTIESEFRQVRCIVSEGRPVKDRVFWARLRIASSRLCERASEMSADAARELLFVRERFNQDYHRGGKRGETGSFVDCLQPDRLAEVAEIPVRVCDAVAPEDQRQA